MVQREERGYSAVPEPGKHKKRALNKIEWPFRYFLVLSRLTVLLKLESDG